MMLDVVDTSRPPLLIIMLLCVSPTWAAGYSTLQFWGLAAGAAVTSAWWGGGVMSCSFCPRLGEVLSPGRCSHHRPAWAVIVMLERDGLEPRTSSCAAHKPELLLLNSKKAPSHLRVSQEFLFFFFFSSEPGTTTRSRHDSSKEEES